MTLEDKKVLQEALGRITVWEERLNRYLALLETDILTTGEIKAQVAIVPFGKRKQISLTFGFTRSVA